MVEDLLINKNNIDYYLGIVDNVELDGEEICEMVSTMMTRPYDGNYLN